VYADWLKQVFLTAQSMQSLAAMNIYVISEFARKLSLNNTYYRSSEIAVSGKGTTLNLAIANSWCDDILAGAGSRNYQDDQAFHEAGLKQSSMISSLAEYTSL
jgi:hypothetical protein